MMRTRPWFYYFANSFLRAFFRIATRSEVRGLDRVPREGPLIVAISHSSFLDPLLTGAYLPRDLTPMAKVEAFGVPVIGWWVKWYGAFPVRRGEADLNAFKTALKILQGGGAIIIAPEGHRSESGALQRGREGAIMLSQRSGAAILPVAVWGGKPFWKNILRLRRTEIKVFVGEPVLPVGMGTKSSRDELVEMSDELMYRIAEMMPPEMRGYYSDLSKYIPKYLKPYRATEGRAAIQPKQKEVVAAH